MYYAYTLILLYIVLYMSFMKRIKKIMIIAHVTFYIGYMEVAMILLYNTIYIQFPETHSYSIISNNINIYYAIILVICGDILIRILINSICTLIFPLVSNIDFKSTKVRSVTSRIIASMIFSKNSWK